MCESRVGEVNVKDPGAVTPSPADMVATLDRLVMMADDIGGEYGIVT